MDPLMDQLLIDSGFDTDAKRALRRAVLTAIRPDDTLWSACWPMTDAYGEPGLVPPQGYDWSGFRDSSYAAIAAMAVRLRAHAAVAQLAEGLGLLPAEEAPARPVRAAELRRLERDTRRLLARLGALCERLDSARTTFALGHLSQAASDLQQAAIVLQAQEKTK